MANLGKVILVLAVYVMVFLAFGSMVIVRKGDERISFSGTLLSGFFLYHVVFQVIAIPVMFAQMPLSVLTGIWTGVAGILMIWSAIRYGRLWWNTAGERIRDLTGRDLWKWIPLMVLGAHVVLASVIYVSFWDATYYVGQVSFSVYTDTINLIDPLSGDFLQTFDLKHCLATYHVNDAVFCQLFRIPPLVETKTVMVIVIAALTNLLYYQAGNYFFYKKSNAVAIFMVLALLANVCTYSAYTASGFLMFRTYEGKAITANLSIPAILLLLLRLHRGEEKKKIWYQLFLVSWGAVAIASSAMFLIPTALAAGLIPYCIRKRRLLLLGKTLLVMLPCLAVIACYLLGRIGWLNLTIRI